MADSEIIAYTKVQAKITMPETFPFGIFADMAKTDIDLSTLGGRIRYVRKRLKLAQDAFAAELQRYAHQVERRPQATISRGAVANWERGKGIDRNNLGALSRRWSVSMDWLENNIGMPPDHLKPAPARAPIMPARNVPLLGMAEGSLLPNGSRGFEVGDEPLAMLFRPPARDADEDLYAVRVSGDSMLGLHPEGELRFVSRDAEFVKGDTVIVYTKLWKGAPPQVIIKTLARTATPGSEVVLTQTNPETTIRIPHNYVDRIHRVLTTDELFLG